MEGFLAVASNYCRITSCHVRYCTLSDEQYLSFLTGSLKSDNSGPACNCHITSTVLGSIPGGVTLGIFSVATDGTMCPGVNSASKNEYQGIPLGWRLPVREADDLPPCSAERQENPGPWPTRNPLEPLRLVVGMLLFSHLSPLKSLENITFHKEQGTSLKHIDSFLIINQFHSLPSNPLLRVECAFSYRGS
jgi:hypothetical protein